MKVKVLVFAIIAAFVVACGGGEGNDGNKKNDKGNVKIVKDELGAKKFKQLCIACHGPDGKLGINGAKDYAESTMSLDERIEIIKNGKGMMTPFSYLKDEEIKALAEYTVWLGKQ